MAIVDIRYDNLPTVEDAEAFSLTIEFDAFTEGPGRILRSAASFSDGFLALDLGFAQAVDPSIETRLVILRFENGSLRTWMASILRSVDDEALKDLDLKKLIGAYLVIAKHYAVAWLEHDEPNKRIGDLESQIAIEARATDVLLIPAYHAPSRALLLEGLRRTQSAKDMLDDGDTASFSSQNGVVILDAERGVDFTALPDVEITSRREFDMKRAPLVVKKPDLLGQSQWQVKHRERTFRATIADRNWLAKFQGREVSLRPGDAIICDADFKILFDKTGTPVSESVIVNKVYGIEYQPPETGPLF